MKRETTNTSCHACWQKSGLSAITSRALMPSDPSPITGDTSGPDGMGPETQEIDQLCLVKFMHERHFSRFLGDLMWW